MLRWIPRATPFLVVAAFVLGGGVRVSAQSPPCERLAVGGVLPGMTADEVRAKLGREQLTTEVVHADGRRATAADYATGGALLRVEYDGIATRRGDARVETVRLPQPLTLDGVAALLRDAGEPNAGRDSLVRGLNAGPVVWLDAGCGVALTYFRRNESWWVDQVNTFLEADSVEAAQRDGAPAATVVSGLLGSGTAAPGTTTPAPLNLALEATVAPGVAPGVAPEPSPPAAAVPAPEFDAPARRTTYVPPVYPPGARRLGIWGTVTLAVVVRSDGTVGETRVVASRPEGHGFEQAARDAAAKWIYAPAIRGDKPVDSTIEVVIAFR
jgi:TonB family protein